MGTRQMTFGQSYNAQSLRSAQEDLDRRPLLVAPFGQCWCWDQPIPCCWESVDDMRHWLQLVREACVGHLNFWRHEGVKDARAAANAMADRLLKELQFWLPKCLRDERILGINRMSFQNRREEHHQGLHT